jgi:hypothetical protein
VKGFYVQIEDIVDYLTSLVVFIQGCSWR